MRIARLIASLTFVGLLAPLPGPPVAAVARPNVIVYLIDTLRSDHLGAYGYARDTSPQIDAFRRDAILFEQAYAPTSWTKPSTASLLTGLDPAHHRAQTRRRRLADERTLLSEYLQPLGYHTAGFVTNPHVVAYWGFGQGYDDYEDLAGEDWRRTGADQVNARIFAYLANGVPAPFFFYVHTIEPHAPYEPKPEFALRFSEHPAPVSEVADLGPDTPLSALENVRAMYDAEIYQNDVAFGALLDELRRRKLYDESIVVLTSDHGEEHLEHGLGGHGQQLFEESIRVPLLIKLPHGRRAGESVGEPVSLIDVVPTLLALVGARAEEPLDGVDLLSSLDGERPLFFELEFERGVLRPEGSLYIARAIRQGAQKYMDRVLPIPGSLLFDLDADPAERTDLFAARSAERVRLARALERHHRAADGGLHLRVASAGESGIEGYLQTSGRFARLRGVELEEGDALELADEGRSLRFRFALRDYPKEPGSEELLQDLDGLVVQVEPDTADVIVAELRHADGRDLPVFLGPARKPRSARPVVAPLGDASLLAAESEGLFASESAARERIPEGGYLLYVPERVRSEASGPLPENLRERLKSLGYLDE